MQKVDATNLVDFLSSSKFDIKELETYKQVISKSYT